MEFNFDWDCISAGAPYITISETGLAFNLPAINLLNNPEEVILGFDKEKNTIGVKSADGIDGIQKFTFYSRLKSGWIRIGCKDFTRYLSMLTGIKFSPAKKYIAEFDNEEKLLYVTVVDSEEVTE